MHEGRMYFDNDGKKTLLQKIEGAVKSYVDKYGKQPDLCLVHPSMLDKNTRQIELETVKIRPYRPVLPNSMWIGIEDKN